ncbi:hypothetical protein NEIPOLOT_01500 [Neisseria polysaccharea ATCC 43768]|nr:hypothetical protein NEIPOLOT_01500 [Neisseria polysaccharea ATCC 43768]
MLCRLERFFRRHLKCYYGVYMGRAVCGCLPETAIRFGRLNRQSRDVFCLFVYNATEFGRTVGNLS